MARARRESSFALRLRGGARETGVGAAVAGEPLPADRALSLTQAKHCQLLLMDRSLQVPMG